MADGFLGRWSRRKQDVREGRPLPEPLREQTAAAVPEAPAAKPSTATTAPAEQAQMAAAKSEPLPTMDDVQALTDESDFKPFVARSVAPEVRNAAMKKLFADPRYNVMDGLDTYIDDYSKPDPLPASMLRQMASASFLNLFDEDENKTAPEKQMVRDKAEPPAKPAAPAAGSTGDPTTPAADARPVIRPVPPENPRTTTEDHAHTDLRLQQNHAAGAPGSGRGAE
jgi:hypothetical protein